MNIDTRKSRVHETDSPEVRALRERVQTLEATVAELKKTQAPPPPQRKQNA